MMRRMILMVCVLCTLLLLAGPSGSGSRIGAAGESDRLLRIDRIGSELFVPAALALAPALAAVPSGPPTPIGPPATRPAPTARPAEVTLAAPSATVDAAASTSPAEGERDGHPQTGLLALLIVAGLATGWLVIHRLRNRSSQERQSRAGEPRIPFEQSDSQIELLLSEARALLATGDVDAAQDLLRGFLKKVPDHSRAWYLWSFVEPTTRGQVNALRQALRIDPDFEDAQIRLEGLKGTPPAARQPPEVPAKPEPSLAPAAAILEAPKTRGTFPSVARFVLRRGLVILLTIVVGVYVTILICNKTGQIDDNVRSQIEDQIRWMRRQEYLKGFSSEELDAALAQARLELQEEAGLNLSPALRNLRWTLNALTFKWGKTVIWMVVGNMQVATQGLYEVQEVILRHLPNTLLIIGTANLITFVLGLPLALFLASRKQGQWLDRFVTMLSPLSSIPSWVHGVILVTIFAIQFRLLPYGGKYDMLPAETWLGNAAIVAKHMVLPVLAVLLGMFFQLVYSWRTFFVIYAEEDYVDLALAKGLHPFHVERSYILRPALPFALTSFALTLIGFWQMTAALEQFFNWPGIGQLYIGSLPQYFEEYFYEGDLSIILSLVVIFAFLLGLTVLLLDLVYAWVDPRIRMAQPRYTMALSRNRPRRPGWFRRRKEDRERDRSALIPRVNPAGPRPGLALANWRSSLRNLFAGVKKGFREVLRYPSAVVGLAMVTLFVAGSLYAVIALPYVEIGEQWRTSELTGKPYAPKNVPAVWSNWFRKHDSPPTEVRKSRDGTIEKTTQLLSNGTHEIRFSMDLEYAYRGFPQDLLLYIESSYEQKRPHLSLTWITPDGRELKPSSPALSSADTYVFSDYLKPRGLVRENEHWQNWFVVDGQNHTPEFYVLFAEPTAEEPIALPGTYRLEVSALAFEPNTDLDIEFVLLGQVYGWAGTDYLRRDLLVPLLWGLPFALAFGLVGATLTTLLAMMVAAAGVWFGGWVDGLVQRVTEINMILPVLAIGVLLYALYDISLWTVLAIVIALNVFSSPTKAFRAAFLQIKEAPYIESARAYNATNARVITRYMVPRIMPTLIPQLVALIPSMVFLEATLGILRVYDPRFPTWGRVIYEALDQQALWGGSLYWVLEPIGLLLLTGLAFALLGFALERILNPRLQTT